MWAIRLSHRVITGCNEAGCNATACTENTQTKTSLVKLTLVFSAKILKNVCFIWDAVYFASSRKQ